MTRANEAAGTASAPLQSCADKIRVGGVVEAAEGVEGVDAAEAAEGVDATGVVDATSISLQGSADRIRVAGIVEDSIVDGPGLRTVIFVQGCDKRCVECHNPDSQPLDGGNLYSPEALYEKIKANPLCSGVTFSGGEPLLQAAELLPLARLLKGADNAADISEAQDSLELRLKGADNAADISEAQDSLELRPVADTASGDDTGSDGDSLPFKQEKSRVYALAIYTGDTIEQILERGERAQLELLSLADILIDGPFVLEEKSLTLPFRGSRNQRILDSARSLEEGRAVLSDDSGWHPG
ncbi:MAG: radical SAM protein [Clostridiales Family XIII bacterium]|jgi:anaerobic ribonucleoside-triphosphate reductase activating protein|nr:radical SAM protein [Clostridiales Family XIII bacterium]